MYRPGHAASILALGLLAGCSSTFGRQPAGASAYVSTECNDLNAKVAAASGDISRTAILRAKVAKPGILDYVPGARSVATKVVDRQSENIEGSRSELRALVAARDGACR